MRAVFTPSTPSGIIKAPPSKSMAHRLLICAGLANGVSRVAGIALSEDVSATVAGHGLQGYLEAMDLLIGDGR